MNDNNNNDTPKPMSIEEQTRKDFKRALVINLLFIAVLFALYFINRTNGFLNTWVEKITGPIG